MSDALTQQNSWVDLSTTHAFKTTTKPALNFTQSASRMSTFLKNGGGKSQTGKHFKWFPANRRKSLGGNKVILRKPITNSILCHMESHGEKVPVTLTIGARWANFGLIADATWSFYILVTRLGTRFAPNTSLHSTLKMPKMKQFELGRAPSRERVYKMTKWRFAINKTLYILHLYFVGIFWDEDI